MENWSGVASSSDGSKLVAVADGSIFTSTNAGLTWISNSVPSDQWSCVASSADGTRLAVGIFLGGIYLSTNSGSAWMQSSAPTTNFRDLITLLP